MADINIEYINETYCRLVCEKSIAYEIQEKFSFFVDNYKHHPKVRAKIWDGKIKLYNLKNRLIYSGLIVEIKAWAKSANYTIDVDERYTREGDVYLETLVDKLNIPEKFTLRDYQEQYVREGLKRRRTLILSPTGSGKSFICYLLMAHTLMTLKDNEKILIIVPTIPLVHQLFSDFEEYGFNSNKYIHKISEGAEKDTDKPVIISTWQSLQYMAVESKKKNLAGNYNPSYFHKFKMVIGDECHTFKADVLKAIMEHMINARYRIGMTGSIGSSLTNKMVLKGLFGEGIKFTSTKELIDNGTLEKFNIKSIILDYPDEIKKYLKDKKVDYRTEVEFLLTNERRNLFIRDLALSRKGNTLIMFRSVEIHAKLIYNMLLEQLKDTNRKVFLYIGEVDGIERENMRALIEKEKDCIVIGSEGTISTGINIVNLHNLIVTYPSKAEIKIIQSIGRILRKAGTDSVLIDIGDDLTWKKHENYAYKHLLERLELYNRENFNYSTTRLNLYKKKE